jgi:predicted lipoprotein with Yx(FWY)xxD motif
MKLLTMICAAALLGSTVSAMAGMIMDAKGNTLYIFDKDKGGVSACYDACAAKWPPYLGKADDKLTEGWTLVDRTDGTKQWAYDGKPMYYFAGDAKPGDKAGDGLGGVWHVIVE